MYHKLGLIVFLLVLIFAVMESLNAQQLYRVYSIWSEGFSEGDKSLRAARNEAMATLGYRWGENVYFTESLTLEGHYTLPEIVAQINQTKVDLIWAWSEKVALAVKQGAPSLPVVALFHSDPVQAGVVTSLAQPGGNITGLSLLVPELNGKRLQLFTELIPDSSSICALYQPSKLGKIHWQATKAAAQKLEISVHALEVSDLQSLRLVLEQVNKSRCAGLLILDETAFWRDISTIVSMTVENGVPLICGELSWAEPSRLSGLSSGRTCIAAYGPSYDHLLKRMAEQADKILKGIPPAEIPVERPTRFDLVINLATAKALGIEIAPSILIQADKIIQ